MEKEWPVTVGMNSSGGMDDTEFAKYIENSIMPLFPDAEDQYGKRVLIKCDGGPGRMNKNLLAKLRMRGFILYPGLPNSTHVTQETDRNYSVFKSKFRENLQKITQD